MSEVRDWLRCATIGVASLLGYGGYALIATVPVGDLFDTVFKRIDGKKAARARDLCRCAEKALTALNHSHDAGVAESARLKTEELLARFGLSDKRFAALGLDPDAAAAEVLVGATFTRDERVEVEPLCRRLLHCFYTSLPENKELLAELLPHIHSEYFRQFGRLDEKISKLLAIAESSGAFQRAAEQGISEAAVRTIVERLGGEGIGQEDLLPWLDNWIEMALRELARRSDEGEAFEAARQEAERRFKAGRISDASSAFLEEFAREQQLEAERQEERKRYRIRLLEEAIRFDEMALEGEAAADKLCMIAEIENVADTASLGPWLQKKGIEFLERGKRTGDYAALLISIATLRAAFEKQYGRCTPLDLAITQSHLGTALGILGEREIGTTRLEEAVAAFQMALGEVTRESSPLDWARTQGHLGIVLGALGQREIGTARLEEAVAAFRAVLENVTQKSSPIYWAITQSNLGLALLALGERESGTARVEEALAAIRAALEEQTYQCTPFDWVKTQTGLALALAMLGKRESGTAHLQEAVVVYRALLEKLNRQHAPIDWARAQSNFGSTLRELGEREGGTARLEEAIAAFRAVLEEGTYERAPIYWAGTQYNLGIALRLLGEREDGTARLEEAVVTFRTVLEKITRDVLPVHWAITQNNLGITLRQLGLREGGTARLQEAIAAWSECLKVDASVWPREQTQEVLLAQEQTQAEIERLTNQ